MKLGFELEADEIIPNLWQGSFPRLLSAKEAGFDVVVLCAQEMLRGDVPEEYTMHGLTIIEAPFDDTPFPTAEELSVARWAASKVVTAVSDSKKVLVTCQAGLNRSGLVCALAVRILKKVSGHEAVMIVRHGRRQALFNNSFASYVYSHK